RAVTGMNVGNVASRVQSSIAALLGQLAGSGKDGGRRLIMPILAALTALLLVLMGVRAIKAQQAHQLQQRFDSLVSAAGQLEAQARTSGDRNEAQSLIKRAQALADQAGTLQPAQPRVALLRKDLQADLDRLDNIVALPDPTVAANLTTLGKDVAATSLVGGATGLFALDNGGHRLIQITAGQKTPAIVA